MYKLKFARTYDFAVMIQNNLEHVLEDYFIAKNNLFCVADGVSRDRTDGKALSYPKSLEEAIDLIKNYPNPSGATEAAKVFAETFSEYISNVKDVSQKEIMEAVKLGNNKIVPLNTKRKIDYMKEDYYCCVAVGGIIKDDILYCFSIGDCRIRLLDKNYDVVFDTAVIPNNLALVPIKETFCLGKLIYKGKWNWNNPKYRGYFRKKYRNNNWLRIHKKYSYGALTGERKAMLFVKTYSVSLKDTQYILAYSDGCEDCLKTKEQIIDVISNPEQIQNEIHEKTLLIYEKE